ncbi:MAG: hypothetical protein HYX42_04105 [Polaromonas sp.]|uniref:hypothetical protein n=1 Tax=Polaromonas sp. TaxID=1869339 RepID=UPI0025CDE02E|nr:hypothetical protein [Polaromonas sp.]MBI2725414.1 hypothetical protein [Polaromonas sp.]
MPSIELIQAVAVTAELCGRVFSEGAARMFVNDLAAYPEPAVLKALARCRREVKGMLTIQDVVARLDDGRPGVEEAWAQMPFDESQSVVWTDEMCRAFGIALPLLAEGDKVAARMAFKEAYTRMIGEARDEGRAVVWTPSLGWDKNGHAAALSEAVSKGRLTYDHAESLVPGLPRPTATIQHLPAPIPLDQLVQIAEQRRAA